jgi:LacI family transcriptional regulator
VIYAAQGLGLQVPEDVSVAGFDDSALATRIRPALTTIRRPVREMARLATKKLIASIDGRDTEARMGIFLEPELVVRDSTRPIASMGQAESSQEVKRPSAGSRRKGA